MGFDLNLKAKYPRAPYSLFKGVGQPFTDSLLDNEGISKTFDEPTYMAFRVFFSHEDIEAGSSRTNFDKFPQPLFSTYVEDDQRVRNFYSSVQYLRDCNEFVRADMLLDFIKKWNDIQYENQWYFQKIEGLDTVMNINTISGRRASGEGRLKISMLEALDLRITHLLNLYRKIAWDEKYQRWILPDMMRNFRMTLYITEFRSFHRSNYSLGGLTAQNFLETVVPQVEGYIPMILKLLEGVTPIHIFKFDRCEFDINSLEVAPSSLTIDSAEMREVSFDVKVGNFTEEYINPIFNSFYTDLIVNGFDRSVDQGNGGIPATSLRNTDARINSLSGSYAQGDLLSDPEHVSGKPYTQSGLLNNLQKIPLLGVYLNEGLSALQTKNVFTILGVARRAIADIFTNTLPSQELENQIVDDRFRELLQDISKSRATDPDTLKLQDAANQALLDNGVWGQIRDLSLATDLVSNLLNEVNTPNPVENPQALRNIYDGIVNPAVPVQDGVIIEGIPTSFATQSPLYGGGSLNRPRPGAATTTPLTNPQQYQTSNLGSTEGELNNQGSTTSPSIDLGSDAGSNLPQPDSQLGSDAGGNLPQPDSQLGSDAGGNLEIPAVGIATSGGSIEGGLSQGNFITTKIEGGALSQPLPGEAVDGDPIEGEKLYRPDPGQATKNTIV